MKYGLVIYQHTDNIGDDIQSYAAMQFLPQVDYLIDRERLDLFCPEKAELVCTLMNGWFLYNKFNWPPSPYVYPLFISTHFAALDHYDIGYDFLNGRGGEYLKQYEPVGCRDNSTLQALQDKGIPAYLSGCLTLTLPVREDIIRGSTIYLVDVHEEVAQKIKQENPRKDIREITHDRDYLHHPLSWERRADLVKAQLAEYQAASCVVTSRLHCALPCLALGTPVLLLFDEGYSDRFSNFLDLLHYCTVDAFLSNEYQYDFDHPKENKELYLRIRNQLISQVRMFIKEAGSKALKMENLPEPLEFKKNWADQASWQKQLLQDRANRSREIMEQQASYIKDLESAKRYLENQLKNYQAADLQKNEMIGELTKWTKELENAKQYLEQQWEAGKATNVWLTTHNNELTEWTKELEKAKQYLEQQNGELSNTTANLRSKLMLLTDDSSVKKIIKKKKYQI